MRSGCGLPSQRKFKKSVSKTNSCLTSETSDTQPVQRWGCNLSAFNALNNSVSYHRRVLLFFGGSRCDGKPGDMVAVGFSHVSPALSLEVVGKGRPEFCEHQAPDFHCFFLVHHTGPLGCVG